MNSRKENLHERDKYFCEGLLAVQECAVNNGFGMFANSSLNKHIAINFYEIKTNVRLGFSFGFKKTDSFKLTGKIWYSRSLFDLPLMFKLSRNLIDN